ncbi:transcriptional regulator family: Fungal Specific TF [Penicillium angulare]|uniref:transcriptional regulator family: Fungal Specific TF n=1 Tax=Penicillium angulare TaxID=116970 RepID=UPI00253FE589|nr:transcriptional regulator family: Fungal Specific TF [Penicillium angulare]KAJ5290776.1 transcriptional regulator family: Fungal Specific TF [Penicillium angulare]
MTKYKNGVFQQSDNEGNDSISQLMAQCKEIARDIKKERPCRRHLPAALFQTFPARDVIDQLVRLYFATTESCYRIIDFSTFITEYDTSMTNLENARSSFLVELLLVLCVTGPMHSDESVRKELAAKSATWLHISQTWLSAPIEKDRLTIKGIQIHCLLLLARQVNRLGADIVWISAGSLIRMGMQMGLHQDPDRLGDVPTNEKEIRRRLWYTILEMNVQAALDSGMVPMITPQDYNTKPPADESMGNSESLRTGENDELSSTYEQPLSFQPLLAESLPLRIHATKIISSLQEEPEYGQVLNLGSDLSNACQKAALNVQRQIGRSRSPQNQFAQSFCSHLLSRFLLCLHFPYAVKAPAHQVFAHSQRVCLEIALELVSLLDDNLYSRLLTNGGGMFRDLITRGALMLYLELNSRLANNISSLAIRRHRANQDLLIQDAHRIVQYAKNRMSHGETNVKGYVFLSIATAQAEALLNGLSADDASKGAAEKSLIECHAILTELAASKSSSNIDPDLEIWMHNYSRTPPDGLGTEFDILNDDLFNFDFMNSATVPSGTNFA